MPNLPIRAKHLALAEDVIGSSRQMSRMAMLANFIAAYPDGMPDRVAKAVQDHMKWEGGDAYEVRAEFDGVMDHIGSRNNMDGSANSDGVTYEGRVARVHLEYPVVIDGNPVEIITVNRPTGRTLQLWSDNTAEFHALLASDLINWPLDVTMEMAHCDLVAVRGVYNHFRFSPPVEPGASGEETENPSTDSEHGLKAPESQDNFIE